MSDNLMVTNKEFLSALFGDDEPWVHVTDFPYDPNQIPKERHLAAWKGDYFSRYHMTPNTNQYFTISCFYADEAGQARRRKALYRHTNVIVLDDVKEKLSMTEVQKLPRPSWILETSAGSEQWGYILNTPCTERHRVENLLDGLVANGLAPDGRDPGMKGVTRYVRLPEGVNTKQSKMINGLPYKCRMLLWEPFNRVTIEQLAEPFHVNLDAARREARVDGAADVADHPLLQVPDAIKIKEVRSDGRFDIVCPWTAGHTNQEDSGAAIFTNEDGSIGFKCHHGSCQERTGRDLLQYVEGQHPGFNATYKNWQIKRDFADVASIPAATVVPEVSFLSATPAPEPNFLTPDTSGIDMLFDQLKRINVSSPEGQQIAASILKHTDDMPKLEQLEVHRDLCSQMNWNKGEFKEILKDLRKQWYGEKVSNAEFYDDVVFIKELNQFYDWQSRIFFSTEAFQNSFSHEDVEARKIALQEGRVNKVDKIDYAPKKSRVFTENGVIYANTWCDANQPKGYAGDISRWQDHFAELGWEENRKHIEQWMAFTIRHPDIKINHMLILGSGEGCGKDFLIYPLTMAMGENATVISGEELLGDFNDHVLSTKYLHINEAELGDRREARAISSKLKPLAAAPPDTLRVNQKGIKPIKVRNIVNSIMTTNSTMPIQLNGTSRRFYALWSDLRTRDEEDNMLRSWKEYWEDRWSWMKGTNAYSGYLAGWQSVIYYLINEVDLSDFNPGEAPPMTDFLRDIAESSKTPMEQTIEAFVTKRLGTFRSDILTPTDMTDTLRAGDWLSANSMYTDAKNFTPLRIGHVLRQMNRYQKVIAFHKREKYTLWIIRDYNKYKNMAPCELMAEYQKQIQDALANIKIQKTPQAVK